MQKVITGSLINYQFLDNHQDKAVVFLPGWGHTADLWLNIANRLIKDYNYYILDLPGFGGSSPLPGTPDVPEYTRTIFGFLKTLNEKQFVLVGHSFGGQISTDLCLKHSQIIEKLILISPAINRSRSIVTKLRISAFNLISKTKTLFPPLIRNLVSKFIASSDYSNSNQYQKKLLSKITRYDLSRSVNDIKLKTLIVWGSEDVTIPYHGKQLHLSMPNSTLSVIYPAGHNPHLTHPNKLIKTINSFLCS